MNSAVVFVLFSIGMVLLIAALSWFFHREHRNTGAAPEYKTQRDESGHQIFVRCPVCNSPLEKKDNLVSKIFHPMTTPDQRMHVLGCPHCYPVPEPGIRRSCPVCHKALPVTGYLIARLFNRSEGKKHVMITGCTECTKHR
jgi:hypothetical protein